MSVIVYALRFPGGETYVGLTKDLRGGWKNIGDASAQRRGRV